MDYLGKNVPKLGFGLMRPPMIGNEVDIETVKIMVDKFMAAGFSYFDTAYGYLQGKSEELVKPVLVDRYPRESFQIATKLPAWMAESAEHAKEMLNISLRRTGAEYFDYYLLHNIGSKRTRYFYDYKIWDYALEQREKGLVKHVGFSFHDKADFLDELLTKHPEMEFVQLQINYADWESVTVQSRECLEVARKHGKPVVIMEPVKGGLLANPPTSAQDILTAANPDVSTASWALRFAASQENLITVLSGMSNIEQMEDNIATMSSFQPLDAKELAVVHAAREILEALPGIPCTACSYCTEDCPMDISIPGIFNSMNYALIFGNPTRAKSSYGFETREGGIASKCISCGQCESVCPQHIDIVERLKHAAQLLEG